MINLVVADDQELIRDGIAAILDAESDMTIVSTAADGAEAVGLIRATAPNVALMDIRMPTMDGIEATRLVTETCATKVLILTTFDTDDNVLPALQAGASGFMLKDTPRASLIAAVRTVAAGEASLDYSILHKLINDHPKPKPVTILDALDRLSPRELEVLKLLGRGASNAEISHALYISETTVKTHIARTLSKLGARDRIHLVVLAHQTGVAGFP